MTLLYDAPVTDPADDALERAPFARALADAIVAMNADSGFVFALHGPWGAGKSTVLNFVLHELRERGTEAPDVVHFNPWWFSGRDQLIQQFFSALREKLGGRSGAERAEALAKELDRFAKVLTPLTFVPTIGGPIDRVRAWLGGASQTGKAIADTISADAQGIRKEIDDKLRARPRKILVVIDDVDRLPASEIRLVFQLVKAVADFPKTIYLLAFDHEVVSEALSREQVISGHDYLAKIVQAPFDLPPAPTPALNRLFFQELDVVLAGTPDSLFDQVGWGNLYIAGIEHLIKTPRDVKRLINAIRPAYPPVRGEVSAHEFVAVQAIRVFAPRMFAQIAISKDLLAGHIPYMNDATEKRNEWKARYEQILSLSATDHRSTFETLLKRLFPRWAFVFEGSAYGSDFLPRWRREGRVCSPEVFDLYFRFALREGAIGLVEYHALIDLASHPEQLSGRLSELATTILPDGRSRVRNFLEGIQYFTDDAIPDPAIPGFLRALWMTGDKLLIDADGRGMFTFGNAMLVMRITHQLLRRVGTSQERLEILRNAIAHGNAMESATHQVSLDYQGLEEHPEDDDHLFSRDQLDILRDLVLDQIHEAATSGVLRARSGLGYILYRWEAWEPGAGKEYARSLASTDSTGFATVVFAFSTESYSVGSSDRIARSRWRVNLDDLESFLDTSTDELLKRAHETIEDESLDLPPDQRRALEVLASGRGSRRGRDD